MESAHLFCSKYEPRIFDDMGLSKSISNLIQPIVEEMGFRIVQVSFLQEGNSLLRILVERDDANMTLRDCEKLSKAISPIIDVENIIEEQYTLEVSSPGVDRPMVRKSDFVRWNNHVVECEFMAASGDKEKVVGKILEASDTGFFMEKKRRKGMEVENSRIAISFDSLLAANLVIVDDLLRRSLVKK
ncbi:MAG: ribosome maturation factor RimP [Candidatus Liberibacter ctenarytainae]|uniref:Ribosome maturation factor RimP n=1 Tax=Candidatus Liberibacter ctenarytainae TaxID=2020335 RepID=A0A937AEP9_9HYPH|nr:ribosome maturation factor RimP [Candidatus Liberibacter ctenarytainae]